mmetsp:Transcript_26570/g.60611  ORF Transcript_26570/g.60611 Transcript_26570/m.60611 type:complete len:276 (+) Transcript_26570:1033-1860(+)
MFGAGGIAGAVSPIQTAPRVGHFHVDNLLHPLSPSPRMVPQVGEGQELIRREHQALVNVLLVQQQIKRVKPEFCVCCLCECLGVFAAEDAPLRVSLKCFPVLLARELLQQRQLLLLALAFPRPLLLQHPPEVLSLESLRLDLVQVEKALSLVRAEVVEERLEAHHGQAAVAKEDEPLVLFFLQRLPQHHQVRPHQRHPPPCRIYSPDEVAAKHSMLYFVCFLGMHVDGESLGPLLAQPLLPGHGVVDLCIGEKEQRNAARLALSSFRSNGRHPSP